MRIGGYRPCLLLTRLSGVDPVQHFIGELFGRSIEGDSTFSQRHDAREPAGQLYVVQVDQERRALAVEVQQRLEDALGGDWVHRGEWLVGEDEIGTLHE